MLKRVKIQGYKSLADVEVYLKPLSILFGPNASGKSNFLDALQLLSRIATSTRLKDAFAPPYRGTPLESFSFGPDGVQSLLEQEKANLSIEVDVELTKSIVNAVNEQSREIDEKNASYVQERYLRYRIGLEILPKVGILYLTDEYVVALNAEGQPVKDRVFLKWDGSIRHMEGQKSARFSGPRDKSFLLPYVPVYHPHLVAMREELASWFFFYLEPRERMRLATPIKEVRHIGLMGEELSAFLNTLHSLDESQFKAVEKALHLLIPSFTGIDISFNIYGEIELKLMQGQTPIPANVLSEGTLRILGLLALGGARETPSLLGFEEPENGIYPDRLDLIASLLRTLVSSGTQVIVTTHSPTLLDLVPEESLYMFLADQGKTVIDPFTDWRARKQAVRSAGINPPLGGIEYTEDLVNAMDLEHLERAGDSLSKFLKELRHKFQDWERTAGQKSSQAGNSEA